MGAERQERRPGGHRGAVRLSDRDGRQEEQGFKDPEVLKDATGFSRQLLRRRGKETGSVPMEGEEQVS